MKTFYRPEMSFSNNESFSPSAGKPEKLMRFLKSNQLVPDFVLFDPLEKEDFYLCHDRRMVDDIFDLKMNNGFGNRSGEVAGSLSFTSGSFFAAAEYASRSKEIVFSPTSGFHHSGFSYPSGFCTFNGLIIAAIKLKQLGLVNRIGIVDCDQHYGDGTDALIKKHKLDFIEHYTYGARDANRDGDQWLERLPGILQQFKSVDIIFYQAGADPHVNDPLGGSLTTEQIKLRDELVFKTFFNWKIPVVWNLAGGYQQPIEKVLEIHLNTYRAALKAALELLK